MNRQAKILLRIRKILFVKWRSGLTFVKSKIVSDELIASPK